jgi:hypothetical protein
MLTYAAVACNCLAAVLFFLGAMKYGRGPVPVTYHRLILEKEGSNLSPHQLLILTAQYRAFAGALLAIGLMIVALSLGPVRSGALWAEVALLLAGGAFVAGTYRTPRHVEDVTGIQTPWRLSLLMGGLLVAGFVLSQLG